jgi:terminase small subunit-like protein
MIADEPQKPKHAGGRPPVFTMEVMHDYCERLSRGELAIEISKEPGMPSLGTVFRWKEEHPEFRETYARARLMQAQACAERAVISGRAATAEDANAARVKMDADKWLAGRLDPLNYAERTQTQNLDKNGNPTDAGPIRVLVELVGEAAPQRVEAPSPRDKIGVEPRWSKVDLVG